MRVDKLTGGVKPQIGVYSYGYGTKQEAPQAQFEFDVSGFRDPVGQKQFNKALGTFPDVRDWVCEDRRVPAILDTCQLLAEDLLKPRPKGNTTEAMSVWVSFSFKDFHGKWISPAIAEAVANKLSETGYIVYVHHHALPASEA